MSDRTLRFPHRDWKFRVVVLEIKGKLCKKKPKKTNYRQHPIGCFVLLESNTVIQWNMKSTADPVEWGHPDNEDNIILQNCSLQKTRTPLKYTGTFGPISKGILISQGVLKCLSHTHSPQTKAKFFPLFFFLFSLIAIKPWNASI